MVTRRRFLWDFAKAGGCVTTAAAALDLLASEPAGFHLEGRAPAGRDWRVVVLGGGIAGLCTAYELAKLGYSCTVLEARERPGGRCWTIRGGTEETEIGGERQVCEYDPGHFLNGGPMRISHLHDKTLGYCRELGLPLITFTNVNEAAYVHRDGEAPMRLREVRTDWRGYTSELLSKMVKKSRLDQPLTKQDRERLVELLKSEGRLDARLRYPRLGDTSAKHSHPSHARGYTRQPASLDEPGSPSHPVELEALLKSGIVDRLAAGGGLHQQTAMLTIDGGMDRLPRAFAARLGDAVRYGAEVRAIRRDGDGVRIAYCQGDEAKELRADSCVAALPPVLLRNIPSDFGPAVVTALAGLKAAAAGKIGLQFARRFWEEDDGIYGGISYSSQPISQIVYPSDGFQGRSGVVVGYYHSGTAKDTLDVHPFKERERLALEQGAKLHPQYREEFCSSFSVAWQRVPRSEMPWVEWTTEADFDVAAKSLGAGDPPFFFAGDYLSYMSGWMQGALASAHKVVGDVHRRALRMSAEGRRPASRRFWAA